MTLLERVLTWLGIELEPEDHWPTDPLLLERSRPRAPGPSSPHLGPGNDLAPRDLSRDINPPRSSPH